MSHTSPWTGLPCMHEVLTGRPCNGNHVSIAGSQPDEHANTEGE
jgi:hypothetical protein